MHSCASVASGSQHADAIQTDSPGTTSLEDPFKLYSPETNPQNAPGPEPAATSKPPKTSDQAAEAPVIDGVKPTVVDSQTATNSDAPVAERGGASKLGDPEKPVLAPKPIGDDALFAVKYKRGVIIDVTGPIFGMMRWYLHNRLDQARQAGVGLVVLRINSPGGDLTHSLELAHELRAVDWATTIAFVDQEAISGAAILSLGCDRIYLKPNALIGDAGPIKLDPNGQFQHAEEKIVSYLATAIRELAQSRKRPAAIAEAMVDRKLKVYQATNKRSGEKTYLTEREFSNPAVQGDFDRGMEIPEAGNDRFLTVGGERAVELRIAEGVFDSESQLLERLTIEQLDRTKFRWIDGLVYVLNRPAMTGLLLIIGLVGLYLEFSVPGMSVAGLVSLLSFGIFFWSHALGGTSGWLEIMLFVLGVACLGMELFVFPGFGVFGLTGILLTVLSLVMASQDFVIPKSDIQWQELQWNLGLVFGSVAGVTGLLIVQLFFFDSLPGLGRFRLETPADEVSVDGQLTLAASASGRVAALPGLGARGITESVLRPAGKARIDGQFIDVLSDGDFLDPETPIEVIRCEGNRIFVRKIT